MEYVKLKDVFSIKKGKKVEQVEKSENTIRYIQIDDLRNNDNIKYCEKNERYVYAQERDIIIAWDGANAGTIGYGLNGAIGSTLALLTKNDDRFCTEYCGLFLKSKFKYLRDKCTGATIPHISKSSLEELEIPLISKEEQLKIINIINLSKNLLDKKKDQINLLDELVKSRFVEMFGNPIINNKGWSTELLGEICELKAGKNIKSNEIHNVNSKGLYPCYGGNGLRGYVENYSHEGNINIIGRQGALCGNVKYARGKFYATEHAVVTKPKININDYWLHFALKELDLNRLATGAAQPGLTVGKLNEVEIPKVPIELQNQFADFVAQVDKLKFEMEKSLKELEDNFNSLMQKAFKGELF